MTQQPPAPPEMRRTPSRPSYGDLFGTAVRLVRQHPILWLAGMLMVILQGNANFNINYSSSQPMPTIESTGSVDFEEVFADNLYLQEILRHPVRYMMIALVGLVIFFLIKLIFGTWAKAALIQMGVDAAQTGQTSLGSGWRQSRARLSTLIGFELLLSLPMIVLFGIGALFFVPVWWSMMQTLVSLPAEPTTTPFPFDPAQFSSLFCLIPTLVCLTIPLAIVIGLLDIYGFRSCLLAGTGVRESISRGWQIARAQLGYTVITVVIYIVAGALASALMLAILAPIFFATASDFLAGGQMPDFVTQLLPLFLVFTVVGAVVSGLVQAFGTTLWTQIYLSAVE